MALLPGHVPSQVGHWPAPWLLFVKPNTGSQDTMHAHLLHLQSVLVDGIFDPVSWDGCDVSLLRHSVAWHSLLGKPRRIKLCKRHAVVPHLEQPVKSLHWLPVRAGWRRCRRGASSRATARCSARTTAGASRGLAQRPPSPRLRTMDPRWSALRWPASAPAWRATQPRSAPAASTFIAEICGDLCERWLSPPSEILIVGTRWVCLEGAQAQVCDCAQR